MKRNPKQDGSNLYDCVPQSGPCPMQCNQCFFNRGYYRETPFADDDVPEGGIVRMNCGHDSNIQKDLVIATSRKYEHVFFNTSIPDLDFPGPVVFTANPKEESFPTLLKEPLDALMAVRLRVSSTNLRDIDSAVYYYAESCEIPVILTFMAYYTMCPEHQPFPYIQETRNYVWQERHVNSYWCPKPEFIQQVIDMFEGNELVFTCGKWCRDCRNCETLYWRYRGGTQCVGS